jgi:hypothetical protein
MRHLLRCVGGQGNGSTAALFAQHTPVRHLPTLALCIPAAAAAADLLVDPVVAACGHDFCAFCLDKVFVADRARNRSPACPVCRKKLGWHHHHETAVPGECGLEALCRTTPRAAPRAGTAVALQLVNHPRLVTNTCQACA